MTSEQNKLSDVDLAQELLHAVIDCPHEIEGRQIILRMDVAKAGNATAQLHDRIRAALSRRASAGGEAVAWQSVDAEGKVYLTSNRDIAARWDRDNVFVRPLYAAPAPSPTPVARLGYVNAYLDEHGRIELGSTDLDDRLHTGSDGLASAFMTYLGRAEVTLVAPVGEPTLHSKALPDVSEGGETL